MRLGIDAMGGDFAPLECIKGLQLFSQEDHKDVQLVLFGNEQIINDTIAQTGPLNLFYEIVHCDDFIEMSESPTRAFSTKPDSGIVKGLKFLSEKKIDAFASAGNTGAMMVGAMFTVKTISGILRPPIVTLIPRDDNKKGLLLDIGANADCKPEMLVQFGILGSLFMEFVHNIPEPRVALINIGEEEGKGNVLAQASYTLMKESTQMNFIGNIEGRDIFKDIAEVMVCDGFTGNIILKMGESFYDIIRARDIRDPHFEQFNYENFGGSCILGLNDPVFIGHGISNANAFKNMIKVMQRVVSANIIDKFKDAFIQSTSSIES